MSYGKQREDAIIKPPTSPAKDPAHGAAIIFLHGLDDDAHGWEGRVEHRDSFRMWSK